MYLPRFAYSSKSDFGSFSPPFLAEKGTSLLEHGTVPERRPTEYRNHCDHEPLQQYRPPWEWTLYQANRPLASPPPPSCFNFPREAAQQGLPSPSEIMLNTSDQCFLYSRTAPRFQRAFAGEPRALLDRYSAFNGDSQLLFPAAQNRILPPVFDQFFDYVEGEVDLKADITPGSQQRKMTSHPDWRSCNNEERSEARTGRDSPSASKEATEDAPLTGDSGDSQAPSEWTSLKSLR